MIKAQFWSFEVHMVINFNLHGFSKLKSIILARHAYVSVSHIVSWPTSIPYIVAEHSKECVYVIGLFVG
jgi:hypothetical protein